MPLPRTDPSTAQRRYNVNLPLNRVASTTLSSTVVGSGSRQDSGTSFPPGTILNRLSDEQANLEFNARQAKLNSSTASSNLSPKQGHHNFDSKTSINLQNSSQNLLYPNQPNGLNIHPQNHRLSAVQLHPSPSLNPSLAQLNQSSPQLNTQPPQLLHQPRLQYGLSVQLQKREESTSATPTTLRLDSEATDSSELSPNSDATPRPTSTDMSRRQIQMQRGAMPMGVGQIGDNWNDGYRRRFYEKNQHISYDEQSHSDRSPTSERQQKYGQSLKRSPNSQPRHMDVGSLNGMAAPSSQFSPSELSESVAESQRRGSRESQNIRQSMYDPSSAMAVYNPIEHQLMMPPPPHPAMLSHAGSMGQLWFPPPPPPFTPYYYAPTLSTAPLTADSKTLKKAMKEAAKYEQKHQMAMNGYMRPQSYCCDGVAQVLWAVIVVTLLGLALALVLAFFVLNGN